MDYRFSAAAEALRAMGELVQPTTASGEVLPFLINKATGKIYELAKAAAVDGAPVAAVASVNPLVGTALGIGKLAIGVAQTCQNQAVLQSLSSISASVATLQATTLVIGVGVAGVAVLSAANLWQVLKLRKSIERLDIKLDVLVDDIKQVIREQGADVIEQVNEHLDKIAKDIRNEIYRKELVLAYGKFSEGIRQAKTALQCQDLSVRNSEFQIARSFLSEALAAYKHLPQFEETCILGKLRRIECVWAIEQAIIMIFQLQGELTASSNRLVQLRQQIKEDILGLVDCLVNCCETDEELDSIFPEIMRINNHDLVVLKAWQEQVDWMRSLSVSEQHLLQEISDNQVSEINASDKGELSTPPEQLAYEALKPKSHFTALCDALRLMIQPEERGEYETYISQQAKQAGHKVLLPSNLQQMSDLSVANLYWYFRMRDESEQEMITEEALA